MDILTQIIKTVLAEIPVMVWISIFIVIVNTYVTNVLIEKLEKKLETKKGKEIKIFNHKKIWVAFLWTLILSFVLYIANYIKLNDILIYFFMIMGFSTFLYEAFLKKFMYKDEVKNE